MKLNKQVFTILMLTALVLLAVSASANSDVTAKENQAFTTKKAECPLLYRLSDNYHW